MKLIQEEYEARMKTKGGQIGNDNASKNEATKLVGSFYRGKKNPTRKMIADEHNIPERAIQNFVEWGRGVDAAEEVSPGFKEKILSGEVKVSKAKVAELRKAETVPTKMVVMI